MSDAVDDTPDSARHDSEVLELDADTKRDLNLFGSSSEPESLFEFCDRCRTDGGKMALRKRMANPWANADRIRDTQRSISFVLQHRELFGELPSAYVTKNVERYLVGALPVVRQQRPLEFAVSAFYLWMNDGSFYSKIVQGVLLVHRLIRRWKNFVDATQSLAPEGELGRLVDEMQTLLSRPHLARVAGRGPGHSFRRRLRADQNFRLHEKGALDRLLQLTYQLDALVAMAIVTHEHDFCMPRIQSDPVRVKAEGLVHPFVANAVPNALELDQQQRLLFLTGPNMAGKTTYLRAVATALYLAHLGMGVPARRFEFVPVQRFLTSIAVSDNLIDGVSYFRAEALRVKAVARAVAEGQRVIAIMDEPFKGTNVKDAFEASLAVVQRLAQSERCLFLVSSHLIELTEQLGTAARIDYRYFEAEERGDQLRFDYALRAGVSSQRLGMRVLKEEGVFDLLDGSDEAQ